MKSASMKPTAINETSATLAPLTDDYMESGADLAAYMQNPRSAPAMLAGVFVHIEFPPAIVEALEREADRVGIAPQSLVQLWVTERLEAARLSTS